MKIISLIGFSGSGKTTFITNAIRFFKKKLNYDVAVIKYIHEHRVDKEKRTQTSITKQALYTQ